VTRDPERRRLPRSVWAWVVLLGVYSVLFGLIMRPSIRRSATGAPLSEAQVVLGVFLGMVGILLILRLVAALLELRERSRPDED
jgi:hypothetical protein